MIFLAHCPDRVGLLAQITQFFALQGVNITGLEEHAERGRFFIRIEGTQDPQQKSTPQQWDVLFKNLGQSLNMKYQFFEKRTKLRVVMFCSKTLACPLEILTRQLSESLNVKLLAVVSNAKTIEPVIERLDIPFFFTPTKNSQTSADHETPQLEIIQDLNPDLVILARYMKVLSEDFLSGIPCPIINIHHSFLPSFIGGNPYEQAYERGVKLMGATAHFVTKELDQGPIIAQDVGEVGHQFSIEEMKKEGAHIEKRVFAHAVGKFSEHKVIEWAGRTVVFH